MGRNVKRVSGVLFATLANVSNVSLAFYVSRNLMHMCDAAQFHKTDTVIVSVCPADGGPSGWRTFAQRMETFTVDAACMKRW